MQEKWDLIIKPKKKLVDFGLKEVFRFKDLLFLFVKRDIVVVYKQTLLGPLWFVLQPLLSTITFTFIFGNIAGIPTDGIPAPLFYMCGIVSYNYFGETLRKTSTSFIQNINVFSKVYFPRLIIPLSISISTLVGFFIQLLLITAVYLFYAFTFTDLAVKPNAYLLLLPVLIIIMAMLGLSIGIIIAALTTRYKDLIHLVGFGVQLLMYLSPVIYPLSTIGGKFKILIMANPMTSVIEAFRFSLFGRGEFSWWQLSYSASVAIVLLFISLILFNRIDKSFTDTL